MLVKSLIGRMRLRAPVKARSGWHSGLEVCEDERVNQESLERANAFLAAVVERTRPGEMLEVTPADIGRQMGLPDPLSAARAVRALLARRRLEVVDGRYRLGGARPLEPRGRG